MLNLPDFGTFSEYRPYQTAYFLSREGEIIGCVAEEWRDVISPKNVDVRNLKVARFIIAVEDRRFYERDFAIDVRAIARAIVEDIREGKIVEGGSTIPQQLVKQLLSPDERSKKSFLRKFKELILASRLVGTFSKDVILSLYLNEVYLGHKRYGVEAASRFYFGKTSQELSDSEAAILSGIIKSPAINSPKNHPETAKVKRDDALVKAYQEGVISEQDYQKSVKENIAVTDSFSKSCRQAEHTMDYIRGILKKEQDLFFNTVSVGNEVRPGNNDAWFGLRVETTIDANLQRYGKEGVESALKTYKEKYGAEAIDAEGAFLAVENGSGAILAMIGGSDFQKRKFNHAVNAKRQTGSSFKPVVYASKFEQEISEGISYSTLLDRNVANAHLSCKDQFDPATKTWTYWSPRNFDEKKFGGASYTRRFAIAQSINRPAVWTAQIGNCVLDPRVLVMAKKLGIESAIDPHLPSALGASGVSLMEMVRAYSVFPNKGVLRPTYIISKITNSSGVKYFEKTSWDTQKECGSLIFRNRQTKKNETVTISCGMSEVTAGVMVEALRGVVKFGTARGTLAGFAQPTACKTGTTERYIDAWLICFTPHITLGGWIGGPEDYSKTLGDRATGAGTVGPMIRYGLDNWYQNTEPVPFLEESEEYMKSLVNPPDFGKEMESMENTDPDVEAPQ